MADYQVEFRGLTMGLGTVYHILAIDGLEDNEVRMGDATLPRAGGDIPGLHVAAGRELHLDVTVKGSKGSQALRDDVQALIDAFQHSDIINKFYFEEPGMASRRYVWARSAGRAAKRDPRAPFMPLHKLRLKLADPRAYEEFANTALLTNYDATGGGTDYDVTEYGKEFTVDSSSQVIVNNAGNAKAWPILTFYGPTVGTITEVTLTNTTTGVSAVFATTLLTGQTLTADMLDIVTVKPSVNHVVRLGATNKYTAWQQPRDPFYLAPGDNTLRFEITGGTSTDGTAAVAYRDTWL
jgi:hypothetical protein